MPTLSLALTVTRGEVDNVVLVECDYTPGRPATLRGRPEDCDPGDASEVEVLSITVESTGTLYLHPLWPSEEDRLAELADAAWAAQQRAVPWDAADRAWSERGES